MEWTKELPTEKGWYWFKFDEEEWPKLPTEIYEPKMLWVTQELGGEGKFFAQDAAEIFEQFEVGGMKGLWVGPLVPPASEAAKETSAASTLS
jgi:hypothetical protein